ncbi:MAG: Na+/H+ antiporter NhaA [Thermomicrobiales bacterium]
MAHGAGHGTDASSANGFSIRTFLHHEAFGGVLLLACAVLALLWANSPWHDGYHALWETELGLALGSWRFGESLRHWINDGLMAIFFLVVGLEIKREVLVGELASPRRAILPAIAALCGAAIPAGIYLAFNAGTNGAAGWGIPMATDIAFSLGVLALLGSRIPLGLKVFLTALAIVDDLLAVLVIALFYAGDLDPLALAAAVVILLLLILVNRLGARRPLVYGTLGLALWAAIFASGLHATLAGVLLALTIPARTRIDSDAFVNRGQKLLQQFARAGDPGDSVLTNGERQDTLAELEDVVEAAGAPLQRLEHSLHPWVVFAIVPLFALANAGVRVEGNLTAVMAHPVTLGVFVGLVLGKQIGVLLGAWLATRLGWSELPAGVSWRQIYGVGWLAGIGFTMSLFVADLAFPRPDAAPNLAAAKLGVLAASVVAGAGGWLILRRATQPARAA